MRGQLLHALVRPGETNRQAGHRRNRRARPANRSGAHGARRAAARSEQPGGSDGRARAGSRRRHRRGEPRSGWWRRPAWWRRAPATRLAMRAQASAPSNALWISLSPTACSYRSCLPHPGPARPSLPVSHHPWLPHLRDPQSIDRQPTRIGGRRAGAPGRAAQRERAPRSPSALPARPLGCSGCSARSHSPTPTPPCSRSRTVADHRRRDAAGQSTRAPTASRHAASSCSNRQPETPTYQCGTGLLGAFTPQPEGES